MNAAILRRPRQHAADDQPASDIPDRLARLARTLTPTRPRYADKITTGSALTSPNSPAGRITPPSALWRRSCTRTWRPGDGCVMPACFSSSWNGRQIVGWLDPRPARGEEEARRGGLWAEPVAQLGVLEQRLHGAGMQQHLARFAELRIADRQHAAGRGRRRRGPARALRRSATRCTPTSRSASGTSPLETAGSACRRRHQRERLRVRIDVWRWPVLLGGQQLQ